MNGHSVKWSDNWQGRDLEEGQTKMNGHSVKWSDVGKEETSRKARLR